ncbi:MULTISPECIES: hypothetical protein [Aeromonas]|uniref:hypothetical protein n=1 Tax=Aeromonas TaxID=642 RepID=UPI00080BE204|nr:MULTISPECIES: hypothetical protein [Aeromonas]MDH0348188.1 hypothetical protein [Aeromonas dhakensis]
MTELSRLSALNIEDDILRSYLFAAVRDYIADESNDQVLEYEVRLDEIYRRDLAAYRVYGNADLRWVFSVSADVEDEADPLPEGAILRLPPAAWIRETIRHFSEGGGL